MLSKKVQFGILLLLASALVLTGCASPTEDPTIKITQIAMTVQAEITQNALLTPSPTATFTPTVTPTITPTPTLSGSPTPAATLAVVTPPSSGDNAAWVADVTIPDGTVVTAGSNFTKTWTIQNTGTTTWTKDYQLVYLDGILGTNNLRAVKLTAPVAPGGTVDFSVDFTAPQVDGTYVSYWKMYNASGYFFGDSPLNLVFVVGIPTTATPTATATP
jgi:hypothetical protein